VLLSNDALAVVLCARESELSVGAKSVIDFLAKAFWRRARPRTRFFLASAPEATLSETCLPPMYKGTGDYLRSFCRRRAEGVGEAHLALTGVVVAVGDGTVSFRRLVRCDP
jgi:hypothetical protein